MEKIENILRGIEVLVILAGVALVSYLAVGEYQQHVEYLDAHKEHREYIEKHREHLQSKVDALEKKNAETKELLLKEIRDIKK